MSTEQIPMGHVFLPALPDISLKRFRLRYNTFSDVYYHHWDNAVCAPLSNYQGMGKGLFSSSKVERHVDEKKGIAYLSPQQGAYSAHLEWFIDFSCCGLVVMNAKIKMRQLSHDADGSSSDGGDESERDDIALFVRGDDKSLTTFDLSDEYIELDDLHGSRSISIMAAVDSSSSSLSNDLVKFMSCAEGEDCPLDLILELMCPRPKEAVYCGELLLGIKYDPEKTDLLNGSVDTSHAHSSTEVSPADDQSKGGELHVHIVEGAGLIDEDTHKPFKTVVKCEIVPDLFGKFVRETTRKHSAYPTWTEHLIFSNVTRDHLTRGALEVILYDHHHFSSDHTIGGMRMCVPIKKEDAIFTYSLTPPTSPLPAPHSRSTSPVIVGTASPQSERSISPSSNVSQHSSDEQQFHLKQNSAEVRNKSKSLPRLNKGLGDQSLFVSKSPTIQLQNGQFGSNLSVNSDHSDVPSSSHRNSSPIAMAKHLFNLSGMKNSLSPYNSPRSSPRNSPLLGRKRIWGQRTHEDRESDYLYWWMEDVREGERRHWKQVLDNEGEWFYFWHSIHYRLQPAYS